MPVVVFTVDTSNLTVYWRLFKFDDVDSGTVADTKSMRFYVQDRWDKDLSPLKLISLRTLRKQILRAPISFL